MYAFGKDPTTSANPPVLINGTASDAVNNAGQGGAGGFGGFGGFQGGFGDFSGFGFGQDDLEDIISSFFGGGSSKSRKASATKGEDSLVRINLTFDEAIFGCEKSFKISLNTMCQDCNGKGGLNPHTSTKCTVQPENFTP